MNTKQLEIIINTPEMQLLEHLVEENEVTSRRGAIKILKEAITNTGIKELLEIGKSLLFKLENISDIEFKEII